MAEEVKIPGDIKTYGAYAILRQSGDKLERELEREFPSVYREVISVALIDLVNGSLTENYQALYEASVLSLWFPGLDLGDDHMTKVMNWIGRPERKPAVLDYMRTGIDIASNLLTASDPMDPDVYELREYYNILRHNIYHSNPYKYGRNLIEFLTEAYKRRLWDDLLSIAREIENDEWLEDVDLDGFLKLAGTVNLMCAPVYILRTPVPDEIQKFLDASTFTLSPVNELASR